MRKPGGQASSPSNPSLLGIAQSSAPRSSFPRSVLVPETPTELFGDAVIDDAFGRAAREIDEAARCYVFGRYTGCVFHLMRVMEIGLRALGRSLADQKLDPATNPTWEKILRRCDDELQKPYTERSAEWQADPQFFSGATAIYAP